MNDSQLKTALLETCPVKPGQEVRAWNALQERMAKPATFSLPWRPVLGGATALACVLALAVHFSQPTVTPVSASSQAPGIFATAFYSRGAHAQVVWLNGVTPAAEGPTYLDPTSQIDESAPAPASHSL